MSSAFREEEEIKPEPPPDLKARVSSTKPKVHMLPRWWKQMYSRDAKKIDGEIWSSLMQPCAWPEVQKTVCESDSGKAPGYDGASIDLVQLLASDSKNGPSPFLRLL